MPGRMEILRVLIGLLLPDVSGLQENLYVAIRVYAAATGTPIVYDSQSHPYFTGALTLGDGVEV